MNRPYPALNPVPEGQYRSFDAIVSSTVMIERNLASRAFLPVLGQDGRTAALDEMSAAARLAGLDLFDAGSMDPALRSALAERELLPRSYLVDDSARVGLSGTAPVWLSFFEREHLAMRACVPGLDLAAAYGSLNALDDSLGASLEWAFDADAGYVMGEAVRCGTGLSACVKLHLPALAMAALAEGAFRRAMEAGFIVSGAYTASAPSAGALYGLSLPPVWREAEQPALERLARAAAALAEYERRARTELLERSPWDIMDAVARGLATASQARLIGRDEAIDAVSGIRLGAAMGMLTGLGTAAAGELWNLARSRAPRRGDEPESAARARSLRQALIETTIDERYRDV